MAVTETESLPYPGKNFKLSPLKVTALLFVLLLLTPFVIIFSFVFAPAPAWSHIVEHLLGRYIINTLIVSTGVALLAAILGIGSAWAVSMYEFKGRGLFEWCLVLPLAIPTYIAAYAYSGLFDFTGPVQNFLRFLTGGSGRMLPFNIQSLPGIIFVMALVLYPYVYITCKASFQMQSQSILEVARMLGKSRLSSLMTVVIPMARPAIVAGLMLVIMETLNDYGAADYYGVDTFTTGIFRAFMELDDTHAALRLAAILLLVVFALTIGERLLRGKARFADSVHNKPVTRAPLSGIRKITIPALCIIPIFFGFCLPMFQLIYWATYSASSVITSEFLVLTLNSFKLAIIAAVLAVSLALFLLWVQHLKSDNFTFILNRLAAIGYSVPGAVIAIGVMIFCIWLDSKLSADSFIISGTLTAVVFAYLIRFMAVGMNPIDSGFKRLGGTLGEASRSLGHGPFSTLLKIELPILRGAMLGATLLLFVDILKELPLTLILRPSGFETLATITYNLADQEMLAQSSVYAIMIVLTGLLPIFFLNRLMTKKQATEKQSDDSHS